MRRLIGLIFLSTLVAGPAAAVEEDRGVRGFYLGGGFGLALGTVVDEAGSNPGGYLGQTMHLRLGEEAIPGLTIGLNIGGMSAEADDGTYEASLAGFFIELAWRPEELSRNLVAVFGTGVGGGSITPTKDRGPSGNGGGAMFELGVMYEFQLTGDTDGLALAPSVFWYFVPDTPNNPVRFNTFAIGLETTWYFGR